MKPADEIKAPTATEVLDIETLQEAYQHGLYALAAWQPVEKVIRQGIMVVDRLSDCIEEAA